MSDYCRILIVDDEYIMRRGIRFMLNWEEQGFEVVGEASNGKEALEMIEDLKPHIVFCDIVMPVMDGIDFIKIAHRRHPDIQILILSGYDKFEYVRQALLNGAADYILKPTLNPEELTKLLNKTAARIPGLQLKKKEFSGLETKLEKFLKGGGENIRPQEFETVFPHSNYRLLGLPVKLQNSKGEDLSQILFEKAESCLKEQMPGSHLKFLYNPEFLCVVVNYPLKSHDKFLEAMENMMSQLTLIHSQAFAVLSDERKRLEDLKQDFSNPEFMEAEMFYHRGVHIYMLDEEKPDRPELEKFDYRKFCTIASEGKYADAAELFRKYISKAVEVQMPEFKLKNQTKNLLYNLIGSVEGNMQQLEEIRYTYFGKIDQAVYVEDFLEVFREMMAALLECLGDNTELQDKKIQQMLAYIAEHYREEMDLSDLADNFSFNYSYLSTYFNTRMGEGFSEYLNRIRIQHACSYLEKSELPIAVISEMTGYSDQSYFSRVFKKITGETPSAYRRGHSTREK